MSCPQGVEERMITGLRGVGDPAIDAVFRKAETIFSAKAFIRSCNFMEGDNKKWLIRKLKELGITQESTADDAARVFSEFGERHIRNLDFRSLDIGHQERSYMDQVHTFAGLLEDYYDEHIRPALGSTLSSQISHAIATANLDIDGQNPSNEE